VTVAGAVTGAPVSEQFTFAGVSLQNTFSTATDGAGGTYLETSVACYVAGTLIATKNGEVAIERLVVGDLARTASGALRPVRWIGWRRLDCRRHPRPADVWPIRVAANAFGEDRPRRDLWLSPGQNVASEGALMPISALINGVSIAQIQQATIEYWHVELDAHDVIFAEGLPAESYLDCGNRAAFANGGAFVEAHADFAPNRWADACLRLVKEGPAVAATKARLLARLVEEGHRLTRKADPNITVDGPNVEPIRLSETRLAFVLPAGGREIALRSNVFIPAHTVAESSDYRSLGLCIGGLQIDGSPVSLDSDATWGWAGMRLKSPTGASRIAGRMARRYFPAARGSSSSIWRT